MSEVCTRAPKDPALSFHPIPHHRLRFGNLEQRTLAPHKLFRGQPSWVAFTSLSALSLATLRRLGAPHPGVPLGEGRTATDAPRFVCKNHPAVPHDMAAVAAGTRTQLRPGHPLPHPCPTQHAKNGLNSARDTPLPHPPPTQHVCHLLLPLSAPLQGLEVGDRPPIQGAAAFAHLQVQAGIARHLRGAVRAAGQRADGSEGPLPSLGRVGSCAGDVTMNAHPHPGCQAVTQAAGSEGTTPSPTCASCAKPLGAAGGV